jgi:hypothetical protein
MTELPIQGILERVLSHVERRDLGYMIMGGFAVRALGIPRPTYDADLTIEATDADLNGLFNDLERDGFIIPDEFRKGFRDTLHGMSKVKVQKFEYRHVWDIDLFLVTTEYQRAAFARRRKERFLGADRWFITSEDLVLHKLLANRRKDLVDVDEILRIHRSVDLEYLHSWAARLGVAERLADALHEAGL